MAENVIEAVEVVAGYVPEVNILNGCNLTLADGRVRRHHRPERRRQVDAAEGGARAGRTSAPARVSLDGDDITGRKAYELVARGVGFVPQTRNVFPSLTVRENLEMGCFLQPARFDDRFEYVTTLFPRLRRAGRAARRLAVRRRAPDGGHGPGADARSRRCCCSTSPRPGCRPPCRTRCSSSAGRSTRPGVAILMVEQNARRCLQVCDRGYVLDQGRNAYTGTGRELLADPKVIELYLGTLAKVD